MTNKLVVQPAPSTQALSRPSALATMASRLNVDAKKLWDSLKNTVFKGATDNEMLALVVVANQFGLNPFLRELYAFPSKQGGIVPVVSIDGWIKAVNNQERFDGVEFSYENDETGNPLSCTCTMYIKGRSRPVMVTEYFIECERPTEPWRKMPRRLLRHKSYIQCGRVAFGIGGIYDEDEATDIATQTMETIDIGSPLLSDAPTPAATEPRTEEPDEPAPRPNGNRPKPKTLPVAELKPEPEPEPEPSEPAPADTPVGRIVPDLDKPYESLRVLMKQDGVTENQIIAYCRALGMATDVTRSIDHLSQTKVRKLCTIWNETLDQFQAQNG